MTEELLLVQIEDLIQKLDRVKGIVWSQSIEERFRNISPKFQAAVNPATNALEELKKEIAKGGAEGQVSLDHWKRFGELKQWSQRILDECLDYLGGIAVRMLKLENDMCDLAEHMVQKYFAYRTGYTWASLMIVGEERIFDRVADATQIVRLRFPEWDVWSLPLSAHEFGRLVARGEMVGGLRLFYEEVCDQARAAREERLKTAGVAVEKEQRVELDLEERIKRHHLETLFADIFATYFMGPAYVYARLYLRLVPTTAFEESDRKPSFASRLAVMLQTLEKLNEASRPTPDDSGEYEGDLKRIRQTFDATVQPIRPGYQNGPVIEGRLVEWFDRMHRLFLATYRDQGFSKEQYRHAKKLVDQLNQHVPAAEIDLKDLTHSVILNAAWNARVSAKAPSLAAIERSATDLCRRIQGQAPRTDQSGSSRSAPAGVGVSNQ